MTAKTGRSRASLGVVFFTVFIDLLGFGIVLPALPFYAETMGASGFMLGVLLSAYSVAQLVGASVLGRWSDRIGRRPVLLISLFGAAIGFALTGVAVTLTALILARALAGLFGGSISTAQAYIADVTKPEERARYMGALGASIGLGFVVGPALGAALIRTGFATTAFVAAGLALVNLLFGCFMLEESLPLERRNQGARRSALQSLSKVWSDVAVRRVLVASFLGMSAFVAMETTLAYLGELRFGLDARGFGIMLAVVGLVMIFVQGGAVGPLTRRFGERRLAIAGALLLAGGLAVVPLTGTWRTMAAAVAILGFARALSQPTLSALLSRLGHESEQGEILGVGQAAGATARAVSPLVAGWAYDLGPAFPYLGAAALSLLAAASLFGLSSGSGTQDSGLSDSGAPDAGPSDAGDSTSIA